ncbi:hypothetical protein Tco_0602502 [Tanacetum coccineum]
MAWDEHPARRQRSWSGGGNGYSLKDKNQAKMDKTEHRMEMSKVKVKSQQVKDEAESEEILNGSTLLISEAWNRFKDLLRACPHHGFSELHQLNTFYNALNSNDQDSLNSAVGGNFLDKMPRDCLAIIESKSKVCYSRSKAIISKVSTSSSTPGVSPDVAELKDMVKAFLLDKKN